MKNKSLLIGILLGIIYSLIGILLVDLEKEGFLRTLELAYIFLVPAVIGGITVFFGNVNQIKLYSFRIMMPWIPIAAFLLTSVIIYLDPSICVGILTPLFLMSASLGGLLTGFIIDIFFKYKKISSL